MKGHVKITKIYDDHEEVVVDDSNILTAGTSVEIIDVMTGAAGLLESLKPAYFQVGGKAIDDSGDGTTTYYGKEGSSLFYSLSNPITDIVYAGRLYGEETNVENEFLYRSFLASSVLATCATATYQEMFFVSAPLSAIQVSSTEDQELFGRIESVHRSKVFIDTFDVRIKLDRHTLVGYGIQEIGLFSENPFGYRDHRPLLLAYKKLPHNKKITNRGQWDLLIEWSIGFLGNSKIYDFVTPGTQ